MNRLQLFPITFLCVIGLLLNCSSAVADNEEGNITSTGPRIGQWELYDTMADPGETKNLAAQQPDSRPSRCERRPTKPSNPKKQAD